MAEVAARYLEADMPSRLGLLATSLAPLLGLAACHPAVPLPSPLALAVDSTAYHRRGQSPVAVPFTLTNNGQTLVYIAQCNGSPVAVIDRWIEGNWRFLEGGFCNGGQPSPLELPPGRSLQGVVIIYDGGAYRLRVSATHVTGQANEGDVSSKEFDVW
jgi:hypothetical protein